MTAVEFPSPVYQEVQSERVHGPRLAGGWRIAGLIAWALVWSISLAAFLLAIYVLYQWDGTPIAVSVLSNPEISAETRDFMAAYQQEIHAVGLSLPAYAGFYAALRLFSGIPYFYLSILIVRRRSDRLMAVLFAMVLAALGAAGRWLSPNWEPLPGEFPWSRQPLLLLAFFLDCAVILFYTFPDGRFVPRWTRWLALAALLYNFSGSFMQDTPFDLQNLPGLLGSLPKRIFVLAGMFALIYRYRRDADAVQKQQIKWMVAGASLLGFFYFGQYLIFDTPLYGLWAENWSMREILISQLIMEPGWYVGQALLAVAVGLALFRYRLWEIDLVINRVLVYSSLTLLTMSAYLAVVSALGLIFQTVAGPLVFFLATGFVAIVFEPLRQRLQRLVNRLMYGERDDPYAVLTRLSNTLEYSPTPGEMLPAIAATVGQALKIPYVTIQTHQNGAETVLAVYGKPQQNCLTFPLIYQADRIGSMRVGLRARGEEFSLADKRLIETIARQAGSAAHAVRLHLELVRSRAGIVTAREEERRRLRRDLHDGLGPILASQTLKMAAVRQLVRKNPTGAEALVEDVIHQNENTVSEVRRLVYGLRPPALDELGLVEAVRDLVRRGGQDDLTASGMEIGVVGPEAGLPKLPAAVEVNAYRIALEALTNAARHAQARHCTIYFTCEGQASAGDGQPGLEVGQRLLVQIIDDGVGIPEQYRAGVGIRSMRERAEELGGQLSITSAGPQGTQIRAWLPLAEQR